MHAWSETGHAIKAGKLPTLAEASAMKLYSTEAATDVAMEAVRLFGGNEIQVAHVAKGLLAGN
ncbi:acyl-CoA dehydrogenase family protein [Aeromicrobium sp.]|uniref:acyl-CoA dehydrogenase family protein n=1 Tax=Aeromicrobium sp. TaxID=1871063 RepID=UPI0039E35E76